MSAAFWEEHEANEAAHAEAKREALRAEHERDLLARIPDAAERICCRLRYAPETCPGECYVLSGF